MHKCMLVKCSNADHPSRDKPSWQGWCFLRLKWEEFGVIILSLQGRQNGRRGNPSCLGGCGPGYLFGEIGLVDRHRHSALTMTIIGEKERSELTFHSSPFNLHTSFTGFFGPRGLPRGNRDNYYLYLSCTRKPQNGKHSHHHPKTLRA